MDLLFTRNKIEDVDRDSFLEARPFTLPSEIMNETWPVDDAIMDSIFPLDNDFFQNFDETQGFDSLDEISTSIKMESEDYEMMAPLHSEYNNSDCLTGSSVQENTSSRSSDSGLSSDHLDIEMNSYDMLNSDVKFSVSPATSERAYTSNYKCSNKIPANKTSTPIKSTIDAKPKVVVQKVPQVMGLTKDKDTKKSECRMANGKEIKIVKLSPKLFTTPNNKTVTIQVKNSNSGAKIQANPGTLFMNKNKFTEVKKLVRVQNPSNPRSVLIPVSIQNMKDFKTFKIANNSTLKAKNLTKAGNSFAGKSFKSNSECDANYSDHSSDSESVQNDDEEFPKYNQQNDKQQQGKNYPKLMLTSEERRLLSKEGITLPTHYPLTKNEERELKRIRRKIRNKISAQDSRKRKKEYVDGLEERVKQCTADNQTLLKKIKMLQSQNHNLASQMKKLQMLITKGTNKTAHPTTCLMVLLLSLALVAAPNLRLNQTNQDNELDEIEETTIQNRRNLLFDAKEQINNDINIGNNNDDIHMMNDVFGLGEFGFLGQPPQCCNKCTKSDTKKCKNTECSCDIDMMNQKTNEFTDFDVDDDNWYKTKQDLIEKSKNTMTLAEPIMTENQKSKQESTLQDYMKIKHHMNFPDQLHSSNELLNIEKTDLFDHELLDMISLKRNGMYELNLDKMQGFDGSSNGGSSGGVYVLGNPETVDTNTNEKRRNFSETQIF